MSAQPEPGGQQGQLAGAPLQQPPQPHAITNAGAPGTWGNYTEVERRRLAESQGFNRDVTAAVGYQVIPIWSDPAWDGTTQTVSDLTNIRARQVGLGDTTAENRPAVRPEDDVRNPSDYAKRFGIRPHQGLRDAWSHSGLTPVNPAFQTSAQSPEDDAYDESLQNLFFDYTANELVAQGAFNPLLPVIWPPDIDEPVHDLFARYRWDQTAEVPPGYWHGYFEVQYGELLDGTAGTYDALTNQVVWDAIEPALKLASRIIRTDHPYWLAMTSMFHMRPVPDAKDGRSPQQRGIEGGTPYTSIWLDDGTNDPRVPAPYPEMARLQGLGFDSATSRDVCLEILATNLKFNIFCSDYILGTTVDWGDWNLLISINASMIWALILNRNVSRSEKATHTFSLASCILHELAHACALIHREMTTTAHLIHTSSYGPNVTADIWASLTRLGDEIYGPAGWWYAGQTRAIRPLLRQQMFVEDHVQGEEGLNFEKQLWGNRVSPHFTGGAPEYTYSAMLTLAPFPDQHPQPLQQGLTQLDQEDRAYFRYLTDHRAPSWTEVLAIPVQWYARYFANGWWRAEFQKFQHHALKLSTNDPKLPTSLLRNAGQEPVTTGNKDDLAYVFGVDAWDWLYGSVLGTLEDRRLPMMSVYLQTLMGQAAAGKLFGTRFANEILAWPHKAQEMARLAQGVAADYQTMVATIYGHLMPGSAPFDVAGTGGRIREMNDSIRQVVGPMLEFSRLMTQEVAYQQSVLTQFLQLDMGVRASFHTHLRQLSTTTNTFMQLLSGQDADVMFQFSSIVPETEGGWVDMLQQKLIADLLGGNAQNLVRGSIPQDAEAEGHIYTELLGEIKRLHRTFNSHHNLLREMNNLTTTATTTGRLPDTTDWPRIQSFARARSQRRLKAYEPAALREFSNITETALVTLVTEALALIASKMDPAVVVPAQQALQTAEQRRVARQALLMENWSLCLRNEQQLMLQRNAARQAGGPGVVSADPTADEMLAQMRDMAGGNADDLRLLDSMYTADTVQQTMDLFALQLLP